MKGIAPKTDLLAPFVIYNLKLTLVHSIHYRFSLYQQQVGTIHCSKYVLEMQEILKKNTIF